jgi:hypothetical protein
MKRWATFGGTRDARWVGGAGPRFAQALLFTLALASACSSSAAVGEDEPGTFLAINSSFQGFHTWEAFTASSEAIANSPHTAGLRTVYLNRRSPAGSTEYPVETIIVKELLKDDSTTDVVARVKRGGTFNASGAVGWEWFELRNVDADNAQIVWRGIAPKAGESYFANFTGGCNACHQGDDSSSILLPALIPSKF